MNLYEIQFRHYAPKDQKEGVVGYLIAGSDNEVYDFIKSEPTLKNGTSVYASWGYKDDPEEKAEYDENFKDRIISCCGEMYDDEAEVSDLYYGLTHDGWNCIKENIMQEQIDILEETGIKIDMHNHG